MNLDAQFALLYKMEARTVTSDGGQVESEEGVPVTEVGANQTVPLVLRHLDSRGEHVQVTSDVATFGVRVVVDAEQNQTFRGTGLRHNPLRNGEHFAVDGSE